MTVAILSPLRTDLREDVGPCSSGLQVLVFTPELQSLQLHKPGALTNMTLAREYLLSKCAM